MERPYLDALSSHIPLGATVLDLGCGAGVPIARHFVEGGYAVSGVDAAPAMVAYCRQRFPRAEWIEADMRALALGLAFLLALAVPAAERVMTDSAGRRVTLPERVERVFAAGPPASVLVYALAPEKLVGWSRALRPAEKEYVVPAARDLPETGRLTGRGDTANLEVVLAARPDLILDFGSVGETYRSLADRVQNDPARVEGTPLGPANLDIEHLVHLVREEDRVGAIVNLFWIFTYPLASVLMITLNLVVVYALVTYGVDDLDF